MLTWAMAYIFKHFNNGNALLLIIAMGCDVAIFYYIALAFGARI